MLRLPHDIAPLLFFVALSSTPYLWHRIASTSTSPNVPFETVWFPVLLVSGFAAVTWRNHRRVTRINRELSKTNERLEREKEVGQANLRIREALEKRLSRAERMESLGALASGIAHDFSNLLVGVVCNAQLLKQRNLSDDARERCLDGILISADRATELAQKMRAYAGREPFERRSVDLVALVERAKPLLRSTFPANVSVRYEFESDSLLANVDEAKVDTMLMSLARNARDAIRDQKGEVIIRVSTDHVKNVVDDNELIGLRTRGGDFVKLEVQDTGQGLNENELGRIFDPFFTTKDNASGMDLAVVYGLVNRLDGMIRCSSQPGQGTTMSILLPKAIPSESDRRQPTTNGKRLPPTGTLVVIDDETSILNAISQTFETLEWDTQTFSSGESAVSFIAENADAVSCILLDVVMPYMDGQTVITKLHERGIQIPIVVMSGCSSTNLNDFVSMPSVQTTLNKPFSVDELVDAVNSAIPTPHHSAYLQAT